MEHLIALITKPDNVPILAIVFLLPYFTWLSFSQGRKNDRAGTPAEASLKDKVYVWPYLCRNEFLCAISYFSSSVFGRLPLMPRWKSRATPRRLPIPQKPRGISFALQEMLVYFDPWIAGVVLPGLIIVGLIAIPISTSTQRERVITR